MHFLAGTDIGRVCTGSASQLLHCCISPQSLLVGAYRVLDILCITYTNGPRRKQITNSGAVQTVRQVRERENMGAVQGVGLFTDTRAIQTLKH